ncbi:MAG: aminomethyltransferase [Myxococcota bacterium]|jgi:aminomethyltransferase
MPETTPFHARTAARCISYRWKDWAGYLSVCSYRECHEMEYFALRQAVGVIDVSPLFKYDVRGPDAGRLLSRIMTRDIARLKPGRVAYTCWCDDAGKLVDDGTVTRLEDDWFRVTAADPSMGWFERHTRGLDVRLTDATRHLGVLSIQGPRSRALLDELVDADLTRLRFFRATRTRLAGRDVVVTRTGFTGDLGFELWVDVADAGDIYDLVFEAGQRHGALPVGLDAMDMTRVEAGFVLNGVDFHSARHTIVEARKSTPLELGLDWTVDLERDPFIGQSALQAEAARGPAWQFVGLVADWDQLEGYYEQLNLPPSVPSEAWRTSVPIYIAKSGRKQIGYASSGTWSPTLKQNLAMAHVSSEFAAVGTTVGLEVTVEHTRQVVSAQVVSRPFFDPPRKVQTPGLRRKTPAGEGTTP